MTINPHFIAWAAQKFFPHLTPLCGQFAVLAVLRAHLGRGAIES